MVDQWATPHSGVSSFMMQLPVHRYHPWRRQLRSHFLFEINGDSVAYCYIRKNACSAFKRMILDHFHYTGEWDDAIDYLIKHHSAPSIAAVAAARWRIFVYRDPFERMTSLFRNKMIMQEGAADFLRNYEKVTASQPLDATFDSFVHDYLTRNSTDPHTRSQASHLLPISYNLVSSIETLLEDMRPVVGDKFATRFFGTRVNRSSHSLFDEPSAGTRVHLLRDRYEATGELPSCSALDSARLRSLLRRIYPEDYELSGNRDDDRRCDVD